MKNISLSLLFLMMFFGCAECFAQVEDPLNQNSLKVQENWSTQEEQVITKKKKKEQKIVEKPAQNKPEQKKPVQNKPKVQVSVSCPEKFSVEFVSLIGNRASQDVTLSIKFTNHDVNSDVYIRKFVAYNENGDSFSIFSIDSFRTLTDVPQNASWKFGQMLPSKNSKITAMSFKLDECEVEIRDIPIDWR